MSGFKLLAIRPLEGCDSRFLKNLKEGMIYKFYQDYKFVDEEGKEISVYNENLKTETINVVEPDKKDVVDLYSDKFKINVSAIVGANGSGKSSVIDFFNTIVYFLSCSKYNTMDNSSISATHELMNIVKFYQEYIKGLESLNIFRKPDFELNIKVAEKSAKELLEFSEKINSELVNNQKSEKDKIIKLKGDKEQIFLEFLWEYSTKGHRNYKLNSIPVFINKASLFETINNTFYEKIQFLKDKIEKEELFNKKITSKFNFQLFYSKNGSIHCIEKKDDLLDVSENDFFYTVLLNYSLHSLNSEIVGDWIFSLFHKNDGYQTPIVINPYRKKGVIDINKELKLSNERLIYSVIDGLYKKSNTTFLSKYKFEKFILKKKKNYLTKYPYIEYEKENDIKNKDYFIKFVSENPFKLSTEEFGIKDYTLGYLIKKFQKIADNYMFHFYDYSSPKSADFLAEIDDYENWRTERAISYITENDSHVTKKFYQSYNFLRNYDTFIESGKLDFIRDWSLDEEIQLTNDQIIEWIKFLKTDILKSEITTEKIILNFLPSIFDVDIEFRIDDKSVKLSEMSSGEQQYLFNINTILYHINNIKSIKNESKNPKVKKYSEINIILDEIELYYHPQYQKNFVKDIVNSINELDESGEVKSFNILFLTHSPFILSDIPNSNVLRIEDGEPVDKEQEQTFAANIHDLLANDFFLEDGFMGEFAKGKINEVAVHLTYLINNNEINKINKEYPEKKPKYLEFKIEAFKAENDFLKKEYKVDRLEKRDHYYKEIISLIGENVLKTKLQNMYKLAYEFDK